MKLLSMRSIPGIRNNNNVSRLRMILLRDKFKPCMNSVKLLFVTIIPDIRNNTNVSRLRMILLRDNFTTWMDKFKPCMNRLVCLMHGV